MTELDNKKYYFGQIAPEEVDNIMLSVTKNKDAQILIWAEKERRSQAQSYNILTYKKSSKTIEFKPPGIIANLTKSDKIGKEIFFRVNLGRFYFFSTAILTYNKENKKYSIEIKDTLYKGQQRGDFRLQTDDELIKVSILINKKVYKCLDLSSGGACFEIDKSDAENFKKDREFFKCQINFNDTTYEVSRMKISSRWDSKNDESKYGIGISFIGMAGQIEEDLFKHINQVKKETEERKQRLAKRRP